MTRLTVSIATRDWDHLTPILLGDVTSERIDLRITRLGTLLPAVREPDGFDGAETSLSRYVALRSAGEERIVGIANFVMRGFRHRCILVPQDSPMTRLSDLKGGRIGVTGWHDTGNIWTRVALADAGVHIHNARWFAGRLTGDHPITDRLRGYGKAGLIEPCPNETPMVDLLLQGDLDAVCTPFLPEQCFGPHPTLRPLLRDVVAAEQAWFHRRGFIPGHHMITLRSDFVRTHPWVPAEVNRLLDLSRKIWSARRRKYAETSPWILDELLRASHVIPYSADDSGFEANRAMLSAFCDALDTQGILSPRIDDGMLFDPM